MSTTLHFPAAPGYRREIDGLRALSLLAVLLYHAGLPGLDGGFRGVDVFFVISGYLITRLLLAAVVDGRLDLRGFYERRARRILPALLAVLLCSSLMAVLLLQPDELRTYCLDLGGATLFSANLVFWQRLGYFAPTSEWLFLLHTWSLALEEQFYLLWPLLLLGLLRFRAGRMERLLWGLALLGLVLAVWLDGRDPRMAFYLLPGRAWQLLAGALVAVAEWRRGLAQPTRAWRGLAGLGLLAVLAALALKQPRDPGAAALPAVLGCALLLYSLPAAPRLRQLLSLPPLRLVGLASYSIYLWQQPLGALARQLLSPEPTLALRLAVAGLSIIVGLASWRWLERPFRDRRRVPVRPFLWGMGTATILLAGFAVAGWYSQGFESPYLRLATPEHRGVYLSLSRRAHPIEEGPCRFMPHGLDAATAQRIADCARRHGPGLLVLGDSRAQELYRALLVNSRQPFIVGLAYPGCRAEYLQDESCGYGRLREHLQQRPAWFAAALYTQAGFHLLEDSTGLQPSRRKLADLRHARQELRIDPRHVEAQRPLLQAMQASGLPVYWLGPLMEPHLDPQHLRRLALECDHSEPGIRPHLQHAFAALDRDLAILLAGDHTVRYLSALQRMQFDPGRDVYDCRQLLWRDWNHWSPAGEAEFGRRLLRSLADEPALAALLPPR